MTCATTTTFDDWLALPGHKIKGLLPKPATHQDLTVWVGWGDRPGPQLSGLFHVPAGTDWQILGDRLADAFFSDASHFWEFYIGPDGKPRRSPWTRYGTPGGHYPDARTRAFNVQCHDYFDYLEENPFFQDPNIEERHAPSHRVDETVGHHWFAWYRFDFGDDHWLSCRFFTADQPLDVAPHRLTDEEQYPR